MRYFLLGLLLWPAMAMAQAAAPFDWSGLKFLLGTWQSEEDAGALGKSSRGECRFELGLEGRVMLRHNLADYPAAGGRPAIHHEDLMVISADGNGRPAKASYWDNEGHLIDYAVTIDADTVTLLTEAVGNAPRFRLRYRLLPDGRVHGVFEIAPPGKPDAFASYTEWRMRKIK